MPRLLLASSSPRRRELLAALGVEFDVRPADIDERRRAGETPAAMVSRLALEKARAVYDNGDALVIGADTAVVMGDDIFGKPRDEGHAVAMLEALSGRTHRVLTGVAVVGDHGVFRAQSATTVRFRDIRRDEARRYWHTGEPRDKAGAYAIQGRGGVFVESIHGSYSGVVGLPVFETAELLGRAGFDVLAASRKDE